MGLQENAWKIQWHLRWIFRLFTVYMGSVLNKRNGGTGAVVYVWHLAREIGLVSGILLFVTGRTSRHAQIISYCFSCLYFFVVKSQPWNVIWYKFYRNRHFFSFKENQHEETQFRKSRRFCKHNDSNFYLKNALKRRWTSTAVLLNWIQHFWQHKQVERFVIDLLIVWTIRHNFISCLALVIKRQCFSTKLWIIQFSDEEIGKKNSSYITYVFFFFFSTFRFHCFERTEQTSTLTITCSIITWNTSKAELTINQNTQQIN